MSGGGGYDSYYEPGRGRGQHDHQGAAGQPEQVRGRAQPRGHQGRQGQQDRGRGRGYRGFRGNGSEVTASEVTAPTEETHVDPMTKDDLKEEEEVNGEQGVQMDTSKGTTEMTLTWVTTVGMPVLYQ